VQSEEAVEKSVLRKYAFNCAQCGRHLLQRLFVTNKSAKLLEGTLGHAESNPN